MPAATTPRRTKSEEKRTHMLLAASELFLANGYEQVSMDQVADTAGVSKQTVYSHFGSKEELFTAVITFKCDSYALTDEAFDSQRPVHTVLKELVTHFSELLMSDEAICMFQICVADRGQRSQIADLFWKAGPQRLAQRFREYLEEQNRLGHLHIDNPHFAAQQMLAMIKGEAYLMKAYGQTDEHTLQQLPAYLDDCISVFEKAYLTPAPQ